MDDQSPRSVSADDGAQWIRQSVHLVAKRPWPFVLVAMLGPALTALMLRLPLWDTPVPGLGHWLALLGTVTCYGLPLTVSTTLACALARAVDHDRAPRVADLLRKDVLRLLLRSALFLFALLLQAFIALALILALVQAPSGGRSAASIWSGPDPGFGLSGTILGTELGMGGGLLLVMQLLVAFFVVPLHLFREIPLYVAWRVSFHALQKNPWLGPGVGLIGVALMILSQVEVLAYLVQVLALPFPAVCGCLIYVGWREVFDKRGDEQAAERYQAVA